MINRIRRHLEPLLAVHRQNLNFAFFQFLCIIGLETVYRTVVGQLNVLLSFGEYVVFAIVFLFLSFVQRRIAIGFVIFLLVFYFFQMGNYNYFGYFIFPIEIYLFFSKQREILEVVPTALMMIALPLLGVVATGYLLYFIDKKYRDRKTNRKIALIFLLILVLPIIKLAISSERNLLGSRPSENKSILKNTIYLSQFFLAKTLPRMMFNVGTIKNWEREEFSVDSRHEDYENIVFVIGESLTKNHMSLFGYSRPTTPTLDSLANDPNFIFKPAISAGVFTDTAIPSLLGVAKQPDATTYIISGRNNLFRLAKRQGYSTYFISAQSHDNFSYIRSYMGLSQIDQYIDPKTAGADDYTSRQDDFLIEELKKLGLKNRVEMGERKKNFIVLNMAGSHEPYDSRYPNQFNRFGSSLSDQYDNSVYYSDHILASIIDYLNHNATGKTIFIYTSDHGQHVGDGGYGKGNIEKPSDYEVPFILLAIRANLDQSVRQFFTAQEWTSHFEIAATVAHFLGYASLAPLESDTAGRHNMFVSGGEINGNSGYAEIHYMTSGFERIYHY